jgi:hypothetical protein
MACVVSHGTNQPTKDGKEKATNDTSLLFEIAAS